MKESEAQHADHLLYRNMGCNVYRHDSRDDLCVYHLEKTNLLTDFTTFFSQSLSTLSRLPQDHFIQLEPIVFDDNYGYVTMERHGEPLTEYIKRVKDERRTLTGEEFWKITAQLIHVLIIFHCIQGKCATNSLAKDYTSTDSIIFQDLLESFLAAPEENKISHGALSPGVIFIDSNLKVKLSVLNLFNYIKTVPNSIEHEATFELMSFAAPEVAAATHLTRKIDAWSLGALMWYLVKLEAPNFLTDGWYNKSAFVPVVPNIERDIQLCLSMLLVVNENSRWNVEDLLVMPRIMDVMRLISLMPPTLVAEKKSMDYLEPTAKRSVMHMEQQNAELMGKLEKMIKAHQDQAEENSKKVGELMSRIDDLEKKNATLLFEKQKQKSGAVSVAVNTVPEQKEAAASKSARSETMLIESEGEKRDINALNGYIQEILVQNTKIMADIHALSAICQDLKQQIYTTIKLEPSSPKNWKIQMEQSSNTQWKYADLRMQPCEANGTEVHVAAPQARAHSPSLGNMHPLSAELQSLSDRMHADSVDVRADDTLSNLITNFVDRRDFWYNYQSENASERFKDLDILKLFVRIKEMQSGEHARGDSTELELLLSGKNRYGQYVLSTARSLFIRLLAAVQGPSLLAKGYSEEYVRALLGFRPTKISQDALRAVQPDGQTLLFRLAEQGNQDFVDTVRQASPDKSYSVQRFDTPLRMGHYAIIDATAMMVGAYLGWATLVRSLVPFEKGQASLSHTSLMTAIFGLQKECTAILAPEESGSRSTSERTALTHAAQHGFVEGVQILLQYETVSGDRQWEKSACSLARSPANKDIILMMLECCMSTSNECSSEMADLQY